MPLELSPKSQLYSMMIPSPAFERVASNVTESLTYGIAGMKVKLATGRPASMTELSSAKVGDLKGADDIITTRMRKRTVKCPFGLKSCRLSSILDESFIMV